MAGAKLSGKVAILTGAALGIGAATAKKLAQLGAIVSMFDINGEDLRKVADECHTYGKEFGNPKPFAFVGDIGDDKTREKFVEDTLKHFGKIDILFNNAGIIYPTSILTTKMPEFDKMINIHVRAYFDLCRLCVHELIKTKGTIVNVASVASHTTFIFNPVYCMAKAAVRHFTLCLADELGPYNVRAVSVSPGLIKTKLALSLKPPNVDEAEFLKEWIAINSVNRVCVPEDIAGAVAFLVSDEASCITGTDLLVDGGSMHKRRL